MGCGCMGSIAVLMGPSACAHVNAKDGANHACAYESVFCCWSCTTALIQPSQGNDKIAFCTTAAVRQMARAQCMTAVRLRSRCPGSPVHLGKGPTRALLATEVMGASLLQDHEPPSPEQRAGWGGICVSQLGRSRLAVPC